MIKNGTKTFPILHGLNYTQNLNLELTSYKETQVAHHCTI